MNRQILEAVAGLILFHTTATAQPHPRPEDIVTSDGIIRAYYEVVSGPAGESADLARDRSLHHPEAWIAIASVN